MEIKYLKHELDDARKQATIDALTGLNNRRGFDTTLQSYLDSYRASSSKFCLLLIDIDHFKLINDTYGHLVGDKVLVGLAKVLFKQIRKSDYLARFGGEEFAIILPDTPLDEAFVQAENIRKSIEKLRIKHIKTGQQIGQITISIGLARYLADDGALEIIERCDNALYKAKSSGRNKVSLAE
ncbi:MAG: GGDEF domain-containing protein [Gammaproteobacteria bacterium]|nr:GGDEF domain-containing protein [Gammaproteobacteria bacterium]